MNPFGVTNEKHVDKLATQLALPPWVVEALIVEYLSCRRFLTQESVVLFDFRSVSASDLQVLPRPLVIMSNATLFHNIPADALKTRILYGLVGALPMAPLGGAPDVLVVGRASPSAFSFLQNLASVTDWKLDLNSHAIVLDSEGMFQWPITEPAPLDEKRGWYQSDIFTPEQLADLLRIHDGIYRIINDVRSAASTVQDLEATSLLQPLRDQLGGLYSELEQVRAAMRDTVRAYHLQSKILPSALIGYTEELPPALTVFDQVRVANGKLQIRLYMERLLFRAAARAAHRASTMRDRAKEQQNPALLIAEEIESAAEAIVLSAMCLEAYINSILQDRLASLASSLDKMGLKEKWLVIPSLLGHLDCFDHTKQPYQDFSLLVTWRNQLAHYKHEFSNMVDSTKTHGAGVLSATYFICNAENAARAVNTIRAMVRQLNTCLDFPVPQWIDDTGWLQPEGALQGKPPKGQSHSRKRIKE